LCPRNLRCKPINECFWREFNLSARNTSVPLSVGGTAVVSCSTLGIEAIQLTGKNESGHNTLEWTSSSELNADSYLIERSEDGVNFSEIGSIDANGLSLEAINLKTYILFFMK
jgi:hypothetical protein